MGNINQGIEWALSVCRQYTNYARPRVEPEKRIWNECNPNYSGSQQWYDCTSFCTGFAYKGGWFPQYLIVGGSYACYTGNIGDYLIRYGWHAINIHTDPVKQGDIIVRHQNTEYDHAEVVYQNPNNAVALSDNYKTIGTGGAKTGGHSVIVQDSNFGSRPCTACYRPPESGYGNVTDGYGWSLAAFCGMIGNIAHEGIYNPGQMEHNYGGLPDSGHGMIQWTNANWGTGYNPLLGAAEVFNKQWYDGLFQCEMLANADTPEYKKAGTNTEQWGWMGLAYEKNFDNYKLLNDPEEAAKSWFINVEWHSVSDVPSVRVNTAKEWYNRLSSIDPSVGNNLSFAYKITTDYAALTDAEILNNVYLMYSLFCGSGNVIGDIGGEDPSYNIYLKRRWFMLYSRKNWRQK